MRKAKCSCGALLKIPDGKDRFRCPQCDKLLKLPSKKPSAQPASAGGDLDPLPDIDVDEDAPTIVDNPFGDDDSDDEVGIAPQRQKMGGAAQRGRPQPVDDDSDDDFASGATVDSSDFADGAVMEDDEDGAMALPEFLRYPKARMWSRLQMALVGLVLALPLIPFGEAHRVTLDTWLWRAQSVQQLDFHGIALLLLPVGGALALICAALPIGKFRGGIVAGFGLAVGGMTFADLATREPAQLGAMLPVFDQIAPQPLLALGALAATLGGLVVATMQVRAHATQPGPLRAIGVLAAIGVLFAAGSLVDANRELFQATDKLQEQVFAGGAPTELYQTASSQTDTMKQAIPHLHMAVVIGLLLSCLMALLGAATTNRWLARIGSWTGFLALFGVPLTATALAVPGWGGEPASLGRGAQDLVLHLGPVWGALALWTLGARDGLAEGLRKLEPQDD